jgi:hypothetical protein
MSMAAWMAPVLALAMLGALELVAREFDRVPSRGWSGVLALIGAAWAACALASSDERLAIGLGASSIVYSIAAIRWWRAPKKPRAYAVISLTGVAGLVLVAATVVAFELGGTTGIVLGCSAGAGLVALIVNDLVVWQRAFARIERALVDASVWHEPASGPDDVEEPSTMGLWKGTRVWLKLEPDAVAIRTIVSRWPSDVSLVQRAAAAPTGDAELDALVSLVGHEADWRPLLASAVRAGLVELCRDAELALERQELRVRVRDPRRVEAVLDRCVALVTAVREPAPDPMLRVLEQTRRDPNPNVRATVFRWLVSSEWNVQEVYAAAKLDPDPAIAAWAANAVFGESAFR